MRRVGPISTWKERRHFVTFPKHIIHTSTTSSRVLFDLVDYFDQLQDAIIPPFFLIFPQWYCFFSSLSLSLSLSHTHTHTHILNGQYCHLKITNISSFPFPCSSFFSLSWGVISHSCLINEIFYFYQLSMGVRCEKHMFVILYRLHPHLFMQVYLFISFGLKILTRSF